MDVEHFEKTLANGVKNSNPKSPLAWAMFHRKTIRFGNKADPFQVAELEHQASKEALLVLKAYKWPVVIETKFTHILKEYEYLLLDMKSHLHIMPIISPGFLDDWEELLGTDPNEPNEAPLDTDNDGIPNGDEYNSLPWMDTDDDGDGVPDS
jgi:hypothetical protein